MDDRRVRFFDRTRRQLAAYYLADPDNPYQQSGRSSGHVRWEQTRRCMADVVDRPGSYLDVGCANGLLLESVEAWLHKRGLHIEPFGLDFVPDLVELARLRVPAGVFWVGNAWEWTPPRRFDYVRTNLEYVPVEDRPAFVKRQLDWVVPGGRLIVCYYRDRDAPPVDVGRFLEEAGFDVGGVVSAEDPAAAWVPRTEA